MTADLSRTRLTEAQAEFLRWLPEDGRWRIVNIQRSGCQRDMAPVRQQCRRKGLAEMSESRRRAWRLTPAGREALETASPSTQERPDD